MDNAGDAPLHPTAQKLVDTVIEMLETTSYNNIKSENVLLRSGVTRGPLYHHFEDFDDLIRTAQIQLYKNFVSNLTSQLLEVLEHSDTLENVREHMHDFITKRSNRMERYVLRQRVGIIHNAASQPALRERLSETQEALTLEWIKAYQICVARGWADPDLDARAVAVLMQSSFIGRVLDGLSEQQMDVEEWVKVLFRLFDIFFFRSAKPFN
jgi:AcrR family transcriptional regulator